MRSQTERSVMDVPAIIAELAASDRVATEDEIRQIREYVVERGFDPDARERVRGRGAGIIWRGRTLRGRDMLPPAEAHYVRHVLAEQEWPQGISLEEYLKSVATVVLDQKGGVFLSYYQDRLQLGFLSRSGRWRGPWGDDWILVDYRSSTRHIVTAFQIDEPKTVERQHGRRMIRWLRTPG